MSRHQQKIIERYYEHKDTINANRLAEIVSDLYLSEGGSAAKLWDRAAKTLEALGLEPKEVQSLVRTRDLEGLARLAGELAVGGTRPKKAETDTNTPGTTSKPTPTGAAAKPAKSQPLDKSDATSPEVQKAALKAFKKRLKLNRLDEESKIGRSPLTGGQSSRIVAIQPPRDYPQAVWDELVRQKKLKPAGRGFYELG